MATMDQPMAEMKEEKTWAVTWGTFLSEVKREGFIAAPMVAVSVLQYLLQLVSMIMAGHLDQLALSSVAIAISLTNVTGFSLLVSPLPSHHPTSITSFFSLHQVSFLFLGIKMDTAMHFKAHEHLAN